MTTILISSKKWTRFFSAEIYDKFIFVLIGKNNRRVALKIASAMVIIF